jgi:hypothetical protein
MTKYPQIYHTTREVSNLNVSGAVKSLTSLRRFCLLQLPISSSCRALSVAYCITVTPAHSMSEFTHPEAAAQHNISRGDEASMRYRLAVAHEEMNSRRRNTMEDCHRILPTLNEGPNNFSYFGIYDGHGGRQLVDFLEESLEQNLITELKEPDDASVLERMSR